MVSARPSRAMNSAASIELDASGSNIDHTASTTERIDCRRSFQKQCHAQCFQTNYRDQLHPSCRNSAIAGAASARPARTCLTQSLHLSGSGNFCSLIMAAVLSAAFKPVGTHLHNTGQLRQPLLSHGFLAAFRRAAVCQMALSATVLSVHFVSRPPLEVRLLPCMPLPS